MHFSINNESLLQTAIFFHFEMKGHGSVAPFN